MPTTNKSAPACPLCLGHSEAFYSDTKTKRHYWRCKQCDLTYLDPGHRLNRADEQAVYDLHQNDPADHRYRAYLKPAFDAIAQRHPATASGLDYGAGPGPVLASMLRERGHRMALYDPIYGPALNDETYDFIVCTEVVEHFFQPHAEFSRLHQLLRSGSSLAVMTRLMVAPDLFPNWHYRRDPTHVAFYSNQTFVWIKEHFGFKSLTSDHKSLIVFTR